MLVVLELISAVEWMRATSVLPLLKLDACAPVMSRVYKSPPPHVLYFILLALVSLIFGEEFSSSPRYFLPFRPTHCLKTPWKRYRGWIPDSLFLTELFYNAKST